MVVKLTEKNRVKVDMFIVMSSHVFICDNVTFLYGAAFCRSK